MPVVTGQITSFSVPENARDLSTAFNLISLPNTPIFNAMAMPGSAVAVKREWWDDVRMPIGTTTGAAYTAAAGTITLASADGVRVGSILQVEGSVYRVTAINTSTKVATIAIVSGDANHASGVKVIFAGMAKKEGNLFEDSDFTQKVKRYNMTQIFDDFIEVSGTQEAVNREVSMGNFLAQESEKKLRRLYLMLARTVCNGVRVEPADNTTPRLMGGLDWFIAQNGYNPAAAAFSADNFDAFLYELEQSYGQTATEAYMNPADLKRFAGLRATQIVLNREDKTRGEYVDRYISGYGYDVKLVGDPTLPAGKIRVFKLDQLKLLPLQGRNMHAYPVAKAGDSTRYGIVGEYTMEFNASNTAGAFSISA